MLEHLGFCGWDIAILVLMIGMTAVFILLHRRNRLQQKQLKDKIIASSLKNSLDERRI